MSSEYTLTGRNGKFKVDDDIIARLTQWAVNPTLATSSDWGDSDSGGYTNRAAGRKDCTFTGEGKYDTTDEVFDLFKPGDILHAILAMDFSTPDLVLPWDFPRALCNDFNLTVNVDTEEVIGWTSAWGSDGPYTNP